MTKVLILDDEEDILDVLTIFLEDLDCEVQTVMTPKEALEKIKEESYDYFILDVNFPPFEDITNGVDLANKVRGMGVKNKLICFSGMYESLNESDSLKVFDGLLCKPFTEEDLKNIINKI